MRIALVADLHGNRPATLALERDLARTQPDRVLCLGDIVGKGPSNDFTFDWAMQHCEIVLGGNWDFGVGKKQFSPDPPPAHPAAAGHPLHPPAGPGPSDRRDPHLHPGGLRLQGAAVPAGNA